MQKYNCNNCNKEFTQKYNLDRHYNRKEPCKFKKNNEYNIFCQEINKNIDNDNFNFKNCMNSLENNKQILLNNLTCKYCLKEFCRKDVLKKHILNICKAKKDLDKDKTEERLILIKETIKKDETIKQLISKIDSIEEKFNGVIKLNKKLKIQVSNLAIKNIPKLDQINKNIKKLEITIPINSSQFINKQLIETIIKKERKIDELDLLIKQPKNDIFNDNLFDEISNSNSLNSLNSSNNENIIKNYQKRIKILENITLKRQKRKEYPESSNVVYLITNKQNKKDRIFIVGKAKTLKLRLSTYDKSNDHEVIYYKAFKDEIQMQIAESMVLKSLDIYRERANRDRFILPAGENIRLFTDFIDKTYEFFE